MRLSAAVVTYNDGRDLERCLQSLRPCPEILAIDLGSQDGSVEIARRHGARVICHEWVPFGEKVRRFAAEQASHPWIVLADPDMTYPAGSLERAWQLIECHEADGLGMIYFPLTTYFRGRRLRRGTKARTRAFRAIFHRERVEIPGLLHNRGFELRPEFWGLGLVCPSGATLRHYWVDDMAGLVAKAHRYLPYEVESRLALGERFSWLRLLREEYLNLRAELHFLAFLERPAAQLMLFQAWYIWKANMALRKHDPQQAAGSRQDQ
ncbi:MAG: glycosyltransferase [Anaerolineae bacterium]